MRVYYDTEFIESGKSLQFVSLGAQDENGRIFYAESNEFDSSLAVPWVKNNVLNQLGTIQSSSNAEIASNFENWINETRHDRLELWSYFGAWDLCVLFSLYGGFLNIPSGWPQNNFDIVQESIRLGIRIPAQKTKRHRADVDAVWTRESHIFLMEYEESLYRQNRFRVNGRTVQINGGEVERVDILPR